MNVANLLVRAGRSCGERPALISGTHPVANYATLARRASAIAGGLGDRFDLAPGERVALVMKNSTAYVEALFACWFGGFEAVPINAKLHPNELAYILDHAAARLCFVTEDLAETVSTLAASLKNLQTVVAVEAAEYEALATSQPIDVIAKRPRDTAWLFYTSGTTGKPKGTMLSHRNLLAMTACYYADVDHIDTTDCILHAAPMSHGSGMYILPHVAAAAAQVVPKSGGFDPTEIFELIKAHPGVSFFAAPTMVSRLVAAPAAASANTSNLKTIVYGGGPMYGEDCKSALGMLGSKLVQIYGQAESPMTITALSKARHGETEHPRFEDRLASVGVPQTLVEVMVADDNDQPLPVGTIGEVLVRGDSVMTGYWQNPEASAKTLGNGWLHTGDVGVFDEDGFLTLKDRSKDLIISGGSNIYPREVEEVLLKHPAVTEVAVVGRRDQDWGEIVTAFVVPSAPDTVDVSELDAYCIKHMSRFKRPKLYRMVEALPKNNYGKVLKTELREQITKETEVKT